MVTHIVLFKLKDPSPDNAQRVRDRLLEMKGRVAGVVELEAGADFTRSPRSFDVALITRHADRAALDTYQADPFHGQIKVFMAEVTASSAAADFEG